MVVVTYGQVATDVQEMGKLILLERNKCIYVITIHYYPACAARAGEMIGIGVHVYVCDKNNLNRTLAINSPFQTFAVGLLIEFIDLLNHCTLQKRFPHRVNQEFSYIRHILLYLSKGSHNYGHTNSSVSMVI